MFSSLRYRDYRMIWTGQFSWYTSLSTENLARNWLVWTMTHSNKDLAFVNLAASLSAIGMTLPAGVAADRFHKKTVLVWTQLVTFTAYVVMTLLVLLNWVQLWHVYVITLVISGSMAFNLPTRQALVTRIVPPELVLNAFSLNQVAMSATRAVAPGIAGLLIAWWAIGAGGAGAAYVLTTAVFVMVVVTTFMLRAPEGAPVRRAGASAMGLMREGMVFIVRERLVLSILTVAGVTMAFGMAYQTLLPALSDREFHVGAKGYGLLSTVSGVGALVAGVWLASMVNVRRQGLIFLGNSLVFGIANVALGASAWSGMGVALIAMIVLGAGGSLMRALGQTLVLSKTPPELQGRVMSIYHLDRALTSGGGVAGGVLADSVGAPWALIVLGGMCIVAVVGVGAVQRRVREM